jgi:recombination protein RecA
MLRKACDINLACNPTVTSPISPSNSLLETAALDVIVIDSVAALVPRKELEGEIGDVT